MSRSLVDLWESAGSGFGTGPKPIKKSLFPGPPRTTNAQIDAAIRRAREVIIEEEIPEVESKTSEPKPEKEEGRRLAEVRARIDALAHAQRERLLRRGGSIPETKE